MKTIIVTGGLGFIGSNLINILNKKNFFIINIDKVTYASNFKNISSNIKNYKFYKQDINNQNFIKKILDKYSPSLIFNLAAETHVDRSIDGPKQFINSNINGVFNLLEAIRKYKKKIKLIHISTDEVYGYIINKKAASKMIDVFPITLQVDTEISTVFPKLKVYTLIQSERIILSDDSSLDSQFSTDIQRRDDILSNDAVIIISNNSLLEYPSNILLLIVIHIIILCIIYYVFLKK
jgi:nucleoside-diphosphate-sugar epimerase